jgi:hypothetical protein
MRTTITIDVDNAEEIERLIALEKSGRSFKKVVNHLLRLGIRTLKAAEPGEYKVQVLDLQFRPGVDSRSLNRAAQELEEDIEVHKL